MDRLIRHDMEKSMPFNESTMLRFKNVNDAVKYFTRDAIPTRSPKAIVWLFQQAHEFNVGNVSINVAPFKNGTQITIGDIKKTMESTKIKLSDSQWKKVEQNVNKFNVKTEIGRIPSDVAQRVMVDIA